MLRLPPDLGLVMENESELERENVKKKAMDIDRERDWELLSQHKHCQTGKP